MSEETTEKSNVVEDKRETTGSVSDGVRNAMRYAFAMGYSQGHYDTFDDVFEYQTEKKWAKADKLIDEAFAERVLTLPL